MKSCPTCNRTYPDNTLAFCLVDGSILSAPFDPEETKRIHAPRSSDSTPTEVLNPAAMPGITMPAPQSTPQPTILAPEPPPLYQEKQSTYPQKKRSGKLWLIIGGAASVLVILLALYIFWPMASLGVYRGSLAELFPKSIGDYQLSDPHETTGLRQELGATDGWEGIYQRRTNATMTLFDFAQPVEAQGISTDSVSVTAFKFSSVENAKAGLQNLRKLISPSTTVVDQGTKRKGLTAVGDRLVFRPSTNISQRDDEMLPGGARLTIAQGYPSDWKGVAWTNGSVLFIMQGKQDTTDKIEDGFPY